MGVDMTKGNAFKNIVQFSIPIFIGSILQNFYNIADTIIVGQCIGKEALSVVSNIYIPMLLVNSVIIGLSSGITILISRYYGKKDFWRIGKLIRSLYTIAVIVSFLFIFYGFFFASYMFEWMKVPIEIHKEVKEYFKVTVIGFPFIIIYNFFSAILKGYGESKKTLYVLLVSSFLNILMDLYLIGVLGIGILGAAYSTVIAQSCSAVIIFFCFFTYSKTNNIKVIKNSFLEQIYDLHLVFINGITSMVQNTFSAVSMLIIQGIINTFGIDAISAFSTAYKVESILTVPAVSLGNSLCVYVSQNVGARKRERIDEGFKSVIHISEFLFFFTNIAIWIIGKPILSLIVGKEEKVIDLGIQYLKIFGAFYFFLILLYIYTNYLRANGEIIYPLFNTIFELSVRIILVIVLSKYYGIQGVFFSRPISFLISYLSLQIKILKRKEEKQ